MSIVFSPNYFRIVCIVREGKIQDETAKSIYRRIKTKENSPFNLVKLKTTIQLEGGDFVLSTTYIWRWTDTAFQLIFFVFNYIKNDVG